MRPVRVLAVARTDIASERRYYNRLEAGLGARFAQVVSRTLRKIQAHPEAMQIVDEGIRRWPLERFPHGVMHSVEESEIVVISVFHPLQDPVSWKRRL